MSNNAAQFRSAADTGDDDIGTYSPAIRSPARQDEPARIGPAAISGLLSALARLEEVVDQETAALESRTPIDLQDFSHRKSRSLLELTRMARAVPAKVADDTLQDRLRQIRQKLARNQKLLGVHLAAAQEIASILTSALGASESDGTYGRDVRLDGLTQ